MIGGTLCLCQSMSVLRSCKARLGSYSWAGSQSESGTWVTPAFQLHLAKVDAMLAQPAMPLNIRRPLVGPSMDHALVVGTKEAAIPAEPTQAANMQESQTESSGQVQNEPHVALDAAQTLSHAAHTAAQIASELNRPSNMPRNDSRHCATWTQPSK